MTPGRQQAFTLIEAVAILVLIGLMASAGALSLRSAYRGSQMKDVLSRVKALDRSARNLVQLSGQPGVIHIDTVKGSIRFTQENESHAGLLPIVLPDGYRITDVGVSSSPSSTGTVQIPCSTLGQTPAYTLSLAGPKKQTKLLVVAGLTGQATELEHDEKFDLDKLLSARPDAD